MVNPKPSGYSRGLFSQTKAVKAPQVIMVFVTKFLSLGDTPSFTPFRIPAQGGLGTVVGV